MELLVRYRMSAPLGLFLLLFAAPAFAQFEINPDHFDQPAKAETRPSLPVKKPGARLHQSSTATTSKSTVAKARATEKKGHSSKLHSAQTAGTAQPATTKTNDKAQRTRGSVSLAKPSGRLNAKASPVRRE